MAAPRQPVQWRPTSPPRYRPLTVTPPTSGHHMSALPTSPSIPMPRGGLGPTPSPLASPAFGTPVADDAEVTAEQPAIADDQPPLPAEQPPERPRTRRGRHAAPVERAEHAGPRAALTVAVVALLASAGVVLTWSDINHTTPTAAATVGSSVESPQHAVGPPGPAAPAHVRAGRTPG